MPLVLREPPPPSGLPVAAMTHLRRQPRAVQLILRMIVLRFNPPGLVTRQDVSPFERQLTRGARTMYPDRQGHHRYCSSRPALSARFRLPKKNLVRPQLHRARYR